MTQTHILYFYVYGNDHFSFINFDNSMKSETFNLLQLKYNLFDFLPRTFTISTNNGSYKFNIDMLKDTSSVIFNFLASNNQELEYHLDINDETNIMKKIEQLYQGKLVTFNDNELLFPQKISELLGISNNCIPNLIKAIDITRRFNSYKIISQQPSQLQLHQISLIKFLQNDNIFQKFTINFNGTKYQCNIYAVRSSKKINDFITKNPTATEFTFENDSENDEFKIICNFFNFAKIKITNTNMDSIKQISKELEIECLLQKVDEFIEKYNKNVQKIDDKQMLIESIDEIFDLLYNRKNDTIENVSDSIVKSNWVETEENVFELAACFIQIISVDFIYHEFLFDLILLLNNESGKYCNLNLLIPTIKKNLMRSLGESLLNCAFVYRLFKNGFVSKEEIFEKFFDLYTISITKNYSKSRYLNMESNQDKNQIILKISNIFVWFYPELEKNIKKSMIEISTIIQSNYLNFLKFYFPNKEEKYLEMRDKGEPDDAVTNALLHDDIDSFQKIISHVNDFTNQKVPFNIYDSPIKSEEITYINYAAAHGSLLCFKYLRVNHADIDACTLQYAVFGGNYEIIHNVDQHCIEANIQIDFNNGSNGRFNFSNRKGSNSNLNPIYPAIYKHENDLFDWILQEKFLNSGHTGEQLKFLIEISAKSGNAHCLIQCIDNGFIFSSNFEYLISKAAERGFSKYTQLLFNFFPKSVNLTENDLKSSIIFGNLSIFELFLNNYEGLDDFDKPLSIAIDYDHFKIIKYIVENEFKDEIKLTKSGIIKCLSLSNSNVFKYLINQLGFDKIVTDFKLNVSDLISIADKACENNNLEKLKIMTELILKKFPKANFTTPFITSIEKQSIEICQYLIDKKIDLYTISKNSFNYKSINEKIFFLLIQKAEGEMKHLLFGNFFYQSIKSHNKAIVEFLLSQGIPYENALIEAVKSHDLEIVKIISNHNRKPSFINQISNQGTALKIAVSNNDIEIVKYLLTIPGIDVNLYDENNWTPLITSISQFNIEIVEILLQYYDKSIQGQMWQLNKALQLILEHLSQNEEKMSKNIPNFRGNNYNEKSNQIDHKLVLIVIKKLIEIENIDLNCYAGNFTLLTYACKVNDIELVKMLIESNNVNVNSYAPKYGNTPLMIALTNKNLEIAKLLIESPKTDINQRNYKKETALIIAVTNNLINIVSILINNKKFDKDESRLDYAFFISSGSIVNKLYQVDSLDVNYQLICKLNENLSNFESQDAYLFDTSLTNSVKQKDINKIRLIINHPSFDPFKSQVKTAIFTSAKLDEVEIFRELLLLFDNDVNLYFKDDKSLLVYSCECRSENIINEILNNDNFDSYKSDILSAFCQILQYEILKNQQQQQNNNNNFNFGNLNFNQNANNNNNIVDRNAIYNSMIAIYDYDNKHNHLIDFSKLLPNGKSFLTSISSNFGNIGEIVHFLLEHGCDPDMPDEDGVYPLEHAINLDSALFVHLLIETKKIDFNIKFNGNVSESNIPSSLIRRKMNRDFYSFNAYKNNLDQQYEPLRKNLTYLHLAAKSYDQKIFNELVGLNKIDINSVDSEGETPLFIAIRYFNIPVINRLFLLDDLDYKKVNNFGEEALELANRISDNGATISKNRPDETKGDYLSKLLSIICRFLNK